MESIFTNFHDGLFQVNNGVFFLEGEPVGIVRPSIVEGRIFFDDKRVLSGPGGFSIISERDLECLVQSVISTKTILFGKREGIKSCKNLLMEAKTSRTAAYFCSYAESCEEVCEAVSNIQKAKVLVLGCGGIGSLAAMNLAASYVSEISIVDPDVIEESNLNRQFFWRRSDIGQKKVDILKNEIISRHPELCVYTYSDFLSEESLESLVNSMDLVILTADEPIGVYDARLKALAIKGDFKLITAGYFHSHLTVTYICNVESKIKQTPVEWNRNPWFIGPSFGPANTELAGIAASIALQSIAFPKKMNCSFTSTWNSVVFPRSMAGEMA